MMYRTTLAAGQFNTFNGTGRYFYLVTAADKVRFKFLNKRGTVEFESEFREGMSVDFPAEANSVVIQTETAQYVEFWLGNSKLDYMSLAAGGAASGLQSGRAVCQLGSALAVPADFRRKAITLQALNDVYIGGIGVTAETGFLLKAGEKTEKMNTRGDIYTYLNPANVENIDIESSQIPLLSPSNLYAYPDGYNNVDELSILAFDENTKRLSVGKSRLVYSEDFGETFIDSTVHTAFSGAGLNELKLIGQSETAIYAVHNYSGKIAITNDGGKSWDYLCQVNNSIDLDGNVIEGCTNSYAGWCSSDGKNILVIGNDGVYESFNGGAAWTILSNDGYYQNWNLNNAIIKVGGSIFTCKKGGLFRFSYDENQWITCHDVEVSGGRNLIVSTVDLIYFMNVEKSVLYSTHDNGDTIKIVENLNGKFVNDIISVGESVLINGLDCLGVIKKRDDNVTWYLSNTASGKTKGGKLVATNESVICKQGIDGRDTNPVGLVYPAAIFDGARYPAPLQWLAEIN